MKKSKITFGILLILILLIFSILAFFFMNPKEEKINFEKLIKETTKNTKLIDANTDHNQALDVAEYAISKGIEIPEVIINFDTHSDMYVNYPVMKYGTAGVENWLNEYLAKYPQVKELYWVMPDQEAHHFLLQIFFADDNYDTIKIGIELYGNSLKKDIPMFNFVFSPLTQKAYEQNFIINTKTGNLNEYIKDLEINKIIFPKSNNYKNIKIITCTKNSLPDFNDKKVFLSIDADYISNSGVDTHYGFKINKKHKEISNSFIEIFKTIKDKNINPQIISMTLSPQYLPQKHHALVEDIFYYIIQASGKNDEIEHYSRNYDVPNHLSEIYFHLRKLLNY